MRRLALYSLVGLSLGAAVLATLAFEIADLAVEKLADDLEHESTEGNGSAVVDVGRVAHA